MSSLIPLSSYNLALEPFNPTPALEEDFPVTIRITLAALDPEAIDEKAEPSTLRILKKSNLFGDESDSEDESDEEDAEEEEEEEPKKKIQPKKVSKKSKKDDKLVDDSAEESENDDEESDEDGSDLEDDEEIEEFVLCTLGPKIQYQQTIDLTITPDEEVYFVVTGSYPIHLTGNYVEHPYDDESDQDDEDDSDEDYDLTPDEDEIISDGGDYEIDDLDDVDDVEGKIEEIVEEEEEKKKNKEEIKSPKKDKKRPAEPVEAPVEEPKKSKKAKKEKNVEFTKDLEQGPTSKKETSGDKKKFPTKTLAGGLVIEDRTIGKGQTAKSGNKVGVRYIGKLKNGKVFDKNTSGKPFVFGLGKGEVIKGWDVGVAGMAIGGDTTTIVPASMAYGKKSLPGIPANSELTFDVKLVSLK